MKHADPIKTIEMNTGVVTLYTTTHANRTTYKCNELRADVVRQLIDDNALVLLRTSTEERGSMTRRTSTYVIAAFAAEFADNLRMRGY